MTWAGQSVFALPCGGAGAELYSARLVDGDGTSSTVFLDFSQLTFNVTLTQSRRVMITLTGTINTSGVSDVAEFAIAVDTVQQPDIASASSSVAGSPVAVALTTQVDLPAGTTTIQAQWKTGTTVSAAGGQMHLEAVVGQVVTP